MTLSEVLSRMNPQASYSGAGVMSAPPHGDSACEIPGDCRVARRPDKGWGKRGFCLCEAHKLISRGSRLTDFTRNGLFVSLRAYNV